MDRVQDNEPQQAVAQANMDLAAVGTFSPAEWMEWYQALLAGNNELILQPMHEQVQAVLAHRNEAQELAVVEQPAAAAAAAVPAVSATAPEQLRESAIKEAEERVPEALASIDAAEEACGCSVPELQEAHRRLQEHTEPLARGAAESQRLVHKALSGCPPHAEKLIKKADREIRDIVVLRCRACCKDPKDRDGFLVRASEAYEGDLDKEVRAQLLLAYHKDPANKEGGFVSNNQVAADRRGGPRPRRRRQAGDKKQASGGACSSHENPEDAEYLEEDEGSSSCAAAMEMEPMWVNPPAQYDEDSEDDSDDVLNSALAYQYCLFPVPKLGTRGALPIGARPSPMPLPPPAKQISASSEEVGPQGLCAEADQEVTHPTSRRAAGVPEPTGGGNSVFNSVGTPSQAFLPQGLPALNPEAQAFVPQCQYDEYGNSSNFSFMAGYGTSTSQAYNAQAGATPQEPAQPPRNRTAGQQGGSKASAAKHYRL